MSNHSHREESKENEDSKRSDSPSPSIRSQTIENVSLQPKEHPTIPEHEKTEYEVSIYSQKRSSKRNTSPKRRKMLRMDSGSSIDQKRSLYLGRNFLRLADQGKRPVLRVTKNKDNVMKFFLRRAQQERNRKIILEDIQNERFSSDILKSPKLTEKERIGSLQNTDLVNHLNPTDAYFKPSRTFIREASGLGIEPPRFIWDFVDSKLPALDPSRREGRQGLNKLVGKKPTHSASKSSDLVDVSYYRYRKEYRSDKYRHFTVLPDLRSIGISEKDQTNFCTPKLPDLGATQRYPSSDYTKRLLNRTNIHDTEASYYEYSLDESSFGATLDAVGGESREFVTSKDQIYLPKLNDRDLFKLNLQKDYISANKDIKGPSKGIVDKISRKHYLEFVRQKMVRSGLSARGHHRTDSRMLQWIQGAEGKGRMFDFNTEEAENTNFSTKRFLYNDALKEEWRRTQGEPASRSSLNKSILDQENGETQILEKTSLYNGYELVRGSLDNILDEKADHQSNISKMSGSGSLEKSTSLFQTRNRKMKRGAAGPTLRHTRQLRIKPRERAARGRVSRQSKLSQRRTQAYLELSSTNHAKNNPYMSLRVRRSRTTRPKGIRDFNSRFQTNVPKLDRLGTLELSQTGSISKTTSNQRDYSVVATRISKQQKKSKFSRTVSLNPTRKQSSPINFKSRESILFETDEDIPQDEATKRLRGVDGRLPSGKISSKYLDIFEELPVYATEFQKEVFKKYFKDQFIIDFEKRLKGDSKSIRKRKKIDSKKLLEKWWAEFQNHRAEMIEKSRESSGASVIERMESIKNLERIKKIADFSFRLKDLPPGTKEKTVKSHYVVHPEDFMNDDLLPKWFKEILEEKYKEFKKKNPRYLEIKQQDRNESKRLEHQMKEIKATNAECKDLLLKYDLKHQESKDPSLRRKRFARVARALLENLRYRGRLGIGLKDDREAQIFPKKAHCIEGSERVFVDVKMGLLAKLEDAIDENKYHVFQYDAVSNNAKILLFWPKYLKDQFSTIIVQS